MTNYLNIQYTECACQCIWIHRCTGLYLEKMYRKNGEPGVLLFLQQLVIPEMFIFVCVHAHVTLKIEFIDAYLARG